MKPGGTGITVDEVTKISRLALLRSKVVHSQLQNALNSLETQYQQSRALRLEHLRRLKVAQQNYVQDSSLSMSGEAGKDESNGGIDINDPILQYNLTHMAIELSK